MHADEAFGPQNPEKQRLSRETGAPPPPDGQTRPRLLDIVRRAARARHLAPNTEKAYVYWVRRFVLFHGRRHPREMREPEVNAFLTDLAVAGRVASATQNQALAGLLFLYEEVLQQPLDRLQGVVRAKRPKRLPTVLSPEEVQTVLAAMPGQPRVIATLFIWRWLAPARGIANPGQGRRFQPGGNHDSPGKGGKGPGGSSAAVCEAHTRRPAPRSADPSRRRGGPWPRQGETAGRLCTKASGGGAVVGLAVGFSRGPGFLRP